MSEMLNFTRSNESSLICFYKLLTVVYITAWNVLFGIFSDSAPRPIQSSSRDVRMLHVCCIYVVCMLSSPRHAIYFEGVLLSDITARYLSDITAIYLSVITARYLSDITTRYLSPQPPPPQKFVFKEEIKERRKKVFGHQMQLFWLCLFHTHMVK